MHVYIDRDHTTHNIESSGILFHKRGIGERQSRLGKHLVRVAFLVRTACSFLSILHHRGGLQVTGAARGLGRELCHKFASAGASIACVDIEEEGNNETAELVKKENPNSMVLSYRTNICSTDEIRRLHEDIKRDFGQVDIFIHNAGTVVSASLLQTEDKYMDFMVDLNLKSHFKVHQLSLK